MDDPTSLLAFAIASNSLSVTDLSNGGVLLYLLLVFVLVIANGFFVASEFALVAVRKSRIETSAAEGDKAAIRLLGILDNLNAYISATQLGITLSSLGLGWIGEPVVAVLLEPMLMSVGTLVNAPFITKPALLHTISFVIAFSIITFLHIVFGELAPKTAALELSERVAYVVAVPLKIFYNIFYYPIRILDWAGTTTVRLFGLEPSSEHSSSYTGDEIRKLIIRSEETGHFDKEESKLIDRVFNFSDTTVREAMIPRTQVISVSATSNLMQLAQAFRYNGYSRLPVYSDSFDNMLGVIHIKDILNYLLKPDNFNIDAVLQKPLYIVNTARLDDVLRQMQKEQSHFGFVIEEHGGIEGIVTLEDLLEEIVGDISDEHDEEVNEQIREQPDGSYLIDGGLAVRDLNKRLGFNLSATEGYTTIAGFLMSLAGELLNEGEVVDFEGNTFKVELVKKRRIVRIRLNLKPKESEETAVN